MKYIAEEFIKLNNNFFETENESILEKLKQFNIYEINIDYKYFIENIFCLVCENEYYAIWGIGNNYSIKLFGDLKKIVTFLKRKNNWLINNGGSYCYIGIKGKKIFINIHYQGNIDLIIFKNH